MEEEIMNYEDEVMDVEVEETEGNQSISTGVAIAIGVGLTLAVTAAVEFGKKLIAAHKAKKALKKPEEGHVIEPTDQQIEEVAE